jgi:hypothetical protein
VPCFAICVNSQVDFCHTKQEALAPLSYSKQNTGNEKIWQSQSWFSLSSRGCVHSTASVEWKHKSGSAIEGAGIGTAGISPFIMIAVHWQSS